jgi:hypothetical protein
MLIKHRPIWRLLAACALVTVTLTAAAEAQPADRGRGDADGRGYMMGPGMMDRRHLGRMCSPRAAGFAEWRLDRLERVLKPTDAQLTKFDELKVASKKAAETMRAACQSDVPTTMVGRMEASEKRLDAMLQAVRTMRPALEAFYVTLSDEQKTQIDTSTGRRGRFWHWRDRW